MSGQPAKSTTVTPDELPQSSQDAQSSQEGTAQGLAARMLLASLINEPELADIKLHQAATLKELTTLSNGLAELNKLSADEYSRSVADYMRATRLAEQVKTDLNDISRRITVLKRKLASLDESNKASEHSDK